MVGKYCNKTGSKWQKKPTKCKNEIALFIQDIIKCRIDIVLHGTWETLKCAVLLRRPLI
jgi:hypothetical protein